MRENCLLIYINVDLCKSCTLYIIYFTCIESLCDGVFTCASVTPIICITKRLSVPGSAPTISPPPNYP